MKAVVKSPGRAALLDSQKIPTLCSKFDTLVKIKAAAICRTDIYAAEGAISVSRERILGHEFAGIVEETFSGQSPVKPGDRVVGIPFLSCHSCSDCHAGKDYLCPHAEFLGLDINGAFSEYLAVPSNTLETLPHDMAYTTATFYEPVAAGMAALEAGLTPDDKILILGRGRIARLTYEILKYAGYQNTEVGRPTNCEKLYDVVVETEGIPEDFEQVINGMKPGGKLIMKSRYPGNTSLPILPMINNRITIQAVKYGDFAKSLPFISDNRKLLESFLDASWELEKFEQAFELSKQSEDRKICFQI